MTSWANVWNASSGPDGSSLVHARRRGHLPGFLAIGDAAHAMSPVGGIGINLAIQDAVAAANILAPHLAPRRAASSVRRPLHESAYVSEMTLAHVQHRRMMPTRLTQAFQVFAHKQLSRTLGNPAPVAPPWILRFLSSKATFRRLAARFIAVGLRPEHIQHMPQTHRPGTART